jgi:beta-glucanase (GH16 family)
MLTIRQKIAVGAGLLMAASTGIVGALQSASPATPVPEPVARQQAAAPRPISIIPGSVAPGGGVQKANAAKWAVIVKYGAAKRGKVTKLQKRSGASWVTLKKGKVDKKGYALFAVPPAFPSKPITYRIDGPGSPSASGSTGQWGSSEDFVDEFSGTSLTDNWSHRSTDYFPDSLRTCAKASPKAVKVRDGTVRLSHMLDPDRRGEICAPEKPGKPGIIFGKFGYRLQANIGTQGKQSFLYGVAAARMKFNPLQGQHASFWLQPDNQILDTTLGQEIDVIEWFGKDTPNGGLVSFVYAPSRGGKKYPIGNLGGWVANPDQYLMNDRDRWWKRYHVFSVEWTPEVYVFRIDGQETGRIPASRLEEANGMTASTPEYPILSILTSDYELGKLPKRDEKNNLPQTVYVDWVKTWQDKAFILPVP